MDNIPQIDTAWIPENLLVGSTSLAHSVAQLDAIGVDMVGSTAHRNAVMQVIADAEVSWFNVLV